MARRAVWMILLLSVGCTPVTERDARTAGAKRLDCPRERTEAVKLGQDEWGTHYRVSGCGREVEIHCDLEPDAAGKKICTHWQAL